MSGSWSVRACLLAVLTLPAIWAAVPSEDAVDLELELSMDRENLVATAHLQRLQAMRRREARAGKLFVRGTNAPIPLPTNVSYQHATAKDSSFKDILDRRLAHMPVSDDPSELRLNLARPTKADMFERARRSGAGEACADEVKTVSDPSKLSVTEHQFPAGFGGLIVNWVGAPHPGVLVLNTQPIEGMATNLFYSSDYGASYELAKGITEAIADVYVSPSPKAGQYWVYAIPYKTSSIGYWLSTDDGKSFKKVDVRHHFDALQIHPTKADLILGFVTDESGPVTVDTVVLCSDAESDKSCKVLLDNVFYTEWLNPNDEVTDKVDTILFTRFEHRPKSLLDGVDLVRWEAPFDSKNEKILKRNVFMFEQHRQFLFVTEVPSQDGFDERILYVSIDEGNNFYETYFPFDGRHNHYRIVDASEDMVLVAVQHTATRTAGSAFVEVNKPSSIAGNYTAMKALFSPVDLTGRTDNGELFYDADHPLGCTDSGGISAAARDKIVMVDRGTCKFVEKAMNAQDAGAKGIIVVNDEDRLLYMTAYDSELHPSIPAFMITRSNGQTLKNALKSDTVSVALVEDEVKERALWKASHLYSSDATGTKYSLALKDVLYVPSYVDQQNEVYDEVVDLHKVESQPGTYLANFVLNNRYQTGVSFNKGATWKKLPPPEGARCDSFDGTGCNLHIAMESNYENNDIPTPLSSSTASGIVVANGFLGDGLQWDASKAAVYVSMDGGYTWKTTDLTVAHRFEMLDHGGVLIATATETTDKVSYSIDYGTTWQNYMVVDSTNDQQGDDGDDGSLFDFDDDDDPYSARTFIYIITEPGGATLVAYAYYIDYYNDKWMGTVLDFADMLSRACDRSSVNTESSDYEEYMPGEALDSDRDPCLLGETMRFRRRKACSFCYNGLAHEAEFEKFDEGTMNTCACGPDDFTCIPGYYRDDPLNPKSPCIRDPEFNSSLPCKKIFDDFHGGSEFTEQVLYTLVVGDSCKRDKTLDPMFSESSIVQCQPSSHSAPETGSIVFGVIIALITALVIGVAIGLYASPRLRSRLIQFVGVEQGVCGRIGRCFASIGCFRRRTTMQYSSLQQDEEGGLLDDDLDSDSDDDLFAVGDARAM